MKNKHSELIKQWVDGAKIQRFDTDTNKWVDVQSPVWYENQQYRIKVETLTADLHGETVSIGDYVKWDISTEFFKRVPDIGCITEIIDKEYVRVKWLNDGELLISQKSGYLRKLNVYN